MEELLNSSKSAGQNSPIILFDSSANLEELKSVFKSQKIITFDVESHNLLLTNNITHEISDNYLQDRNLDDIQKLTYKFSQWYEEPDLANELTYEEINVGRLFYVELHYFLVSFIKKFVELNSINQIYNNSSFIASPFIYRLLLCLKTSQVYQLGKKDTLPYFLYDSLKVRISNSIEINISAKNYMRLKNISEKIINILFKPKITNNRNSILLIEFDPIKYRKFFLLSKSKLDLTLLNRRRPAIWNLTSFNIIKKSKSNVLTPHNILNDNLAASIEQNISFFKQKYLMLINNNESFFQKFFSISGISFWPSLKPFFLRLCEKRTSAAIYEIEITKKILDKYRFDAVLVWSENGFNEQIAASLAKKRNIPIILLQHGLYYDSAEALEFNKFAGVLPVNSNIIACWGNSFKKSLERWGFPAEKIKVVGNPAFDDLFGIKTNEKKFVLLATSSPTKNIASDLGVAARMHYIECITKICKTILSLDKNLIVKIHPFAEELDITDVVKSIDPKIQVIKKGEITKLIKSCEFAIVIDISTTIIEAQILGKPVVSFSVKNYNLGTSEVFVSQSVIKTDFEEFEKTLDVFLNDTKIQKMQTDAANKFLSDYLSNQGSASQKLIELLRQL